MFKRFNSSIWLADWRMMLLGLGGSSQTGSGARTNSGARKGSGSGAADEDAAVTDLARARFSGSVRDSGRSSATTTTFFLRGALSFAPAGRAPFFGRRLGYSHFRRLYNFSYWRRFRFGVDNNLVHS